MIHAERNAEIGDESGTDWLNWLAWAGRCAAAAGQRFSQADLMLDAAVSGLGVALERLWEWLIAEGRGAGSGAVDTEQR